MQHIIIVGGGAGGLELAARLGRTLGKKRQALITLVDANMSHVWKPLWHEVAAGTLIGAADEINYSAYAYEHHFRFELGYLDRLDKQLRQISLAPVADSAGGELLPRRELHYDVLVLAVGSITHNFGVPGAVEHCFYLDSQQQAHYFQQNFIRHFLKAQYQPEGAANQLTIAIIGGGATGVELAAELDYAIRQAIRYSGQKLNPEHDVQIIIIEAGASILSNLTSQVIKKTEADLHQRGIKIYTNERVSQVNAEGIVTESGLIILAKIKVWAAGIKAPPFLRTFNGLEKNHLNQLLVRATLQTTQDDNIFALGDCAACPYLDQGKWVPPRAQAAQQQAKFLSKSLLLKLQGKAILPAYHYRDYGSIISLSHFKTVGSLSSRLLGNIFISGYFANFSYRFLYRHHQAVLLGWWRVILIILAEFTLRKIKPRLKLQ